MLTGRLILNLLAFQITCFARCGLTRFVLSGRSGGDITEVVKKHFGSTAAVLITMLYFFVLLLILLIYSVALMRFQLHRLQL